MAMREMRHMMRIRPRMNIDAPHQQDDFVRQIHQEEELNMMMQLMDEEW